MHFANKYTTNEQSSSIKSIKKPEPESSSISFKITSNSSRLKSNNLKPGISFEKKQKLENKISDSEEDGIEIKGEENLKDDMSISFEEVQDNRLMHRKTKVLDQMIGKLFLNLGNLDLKNILKQNKISPKKKRASLDKSQLKEFISKLNRPVIATKKFNNTPSKGIRKNKRHGTKLLGTRKRPLENWKNSGNPLTFEKFKKFILKKEKEMKNKRGKCSSIKNLKNTKTFNYLIVLVIFFSIFGDDIRRIAIPEAYDIIVDGSIGFLGIIFILEIISNIISSKLAYINSIYFFLDTAATLSMAFDLSFFSETIISSLKK